VCFLSFSIGQGESQSQDWPYLRSPTGRFAPLCRGVSFLIWHLIQKVNGNLYAILWGIITERCRLDDQSSFSIELHLPGLQRHARRGACQADWRVFFFSVQFGPDRVLGTRFGVIPWIGDVLKEQFLEGANLCLFSGFRESFGINCGGTFSRCTQSTTSSIKSHAARLVSKRSAYLGNSFCHFRA
jgi:hypothetical protein